MRRLCEGVFATDQITDEEIESGLFLTLDDFREVAVGDGRLASSGTYAFKQLAMLLSGQDSDMYYQLRGVGPMSPELPLTLLGTQAVSDLFEQIIRSKQLPVGIGQVTLRVVDVILHDLDPEVVPEFLPID